MSGFGSDAILCCHESSTVSTGLCFLGQSSHLALIGGGLDDDRRARAGTRLAGRGNARGGDGDRGGGDGGHGA